MESKCPSSGERIEQSRGKSIPVTSHSQVGVLLLSAVHIAALWQGARRIRKFAAGNGSSC